MPAVYEVADAVKDLLGKCDGQFTMSVVNNKVLTLHFVVR